MGTFSIVAPTTISLLTGGRSDSIGSIPGWLGVPDSTDEDLINGLVNFSITYLATKNTGVKTFAITFTLDETSPIYVLDGGAPISFQSLPSGFAITDWIMALFGGTNFNGTVTFELFPTTPANEQLSAGTIDFTQIQGSISSIDFVNQQFKMSFSLDSASTPGSTIIGLCQFFGFAISGNYVIQSTFSFLFTAPAEPRPGERITLTTDPTDPDPLPIGDITEIIYTWNDGVDHEIIQTIFETQNPLLLIWIIPFGFEDFEGPVEVSARIVSTEFSGSVALGTMEILFENASGIYRLVRGKKTDTLYDPDRSGETFEAAIPRPFARTGFIGG